MVSLTYFLFFEYQKEFTLMNVITESEIKEKEDPKTFSLTLTPEQRKYLSYTAIALLGYFLARHLVKSAVKSLRENDE